MDYFSKWPEAEPLPDKTAAGVAIFLYNLFCRYVNLTTLVMYGRVHVLTLHAWFYPFRHGCCDVLISDQGREFVNCIKDELFQLTGTEHRVTSAYHPQSNGLTERFNQTLQTTLLKVVNDSQNDWETHLPAILFAYHISQQKATKLTRFEIMYCW